VGAAVGLGARQASEDRGTAGPPTTAARTTPRVGTTTTAMRRRRAAAVLRSLGPGPGGPGVQPDVRTTGRHRGRRRQLLWLATETWRLARGKPKVWRQTIRPRRRPVAAGRVAVEAVDVAGHAMGRRPTVSRANAAAPREQVLRQAGIRWATVRLVEAQPPVRRGAVVPRPAGLPKRAELDLPRGRRSREQGEPGDRAGRPRVPAVPRRQRPPKRRATRHCKMQAQRQWMMKSGCRRTAPRRRTPWAR
jgi:hypothetical protein